jgi:hypothetical protein
VLQNLSQRQRLCVVADAQRHCLPSTSRSSGLNTLNFYSSKSDLLPPPTARTFTLYNDPVTSGTVTDRP